MREKFAATTNSDTASIDRHAATYIQKFYVIFRIARFHHVRCVTLLCASISYSMDGVSLTHAHIVMRGLKHRKLRIWRIECNTTKRNYRILSSNQKETPWKQKTSFDTVPTNEPAVVSIASSKSFPVGLPPHKQMDQFGYPKCWQRDFRPTCCNHIHDPGRGGRNVPPDLSQCCHHTCGG